MTVLTLTNLSLTEAIECDNCVDIATIKDQLENCYCNDCVPATCDNCDNHDDDLTSVENDNKQVCEDCLDNEYVECQCCDKHVSNDDSLTTNNKDGICQSCYEYHYFTCECCEEIYHNDECNYVDRDRVYVCDTCASDEYTRCYDCGELFSNDDVYYHDRSGEHYCDDHIPGSDTEEFDGDCDLITNYSYDVRADLGLRGSPKDRIYFGIELEVAIDTDDFDIYENAAQSTLDSLENFALLKSDSSIIDNEDRNNGFEIVTTAASYDLQHKHWGNYFNNIHSDIYSPNSCGMHIHVSKKRLSDLQVLKILYFLNATHNYEFLTDIAGRRSSTYARYDSDKKIKKSYLNTRKYEPLNIKRTTIEFRLYASTTNRDEFFTRLELTHAITYYCKYASLKELNYSQLVDFIYKNKHNYKHLVKHPQVTNLLCSLKLV